MDTPPYASSLPSNGTESDRSGAGRSYRTAVQSTHGTPRSAKSALMVFVRGQRRSARFLRGTPRRFAAGTSRDLSARVPTRPHESARRVVRLRRPSPLGGLLAPLGWRPAVGRALRPRRLDARWPEFSPPLRESVRHFTRQRDSLGARRCHASRRHLAYRGRRGAHCSGLAAYWWIWSHGHGRRGPDGVSGCGPCCAWLGSGHWRRCSRRRRTGAQAVCRRAGLRSRWCRGAGPRLGTVEVRRRHGSRGHLTYHGRCRAQRSELAVYRWSWSLGHGRRAPDAVRRRRPGWTRLDTRRWGLRSQRRRSDGVRSPAGPFARWRCPRCRDASPCRLDTLEVRRSQRLRALGSTLAERWARRYDRGIGAPRRRHKSRRRHDAGGGGALAVLGDRDDRRGMWLARRDHGTRDALIRRSYASASGGDQAGRHRADIQMSADGLEAADIHVRDAARRDRSVAEALMLDCHHGVLHGRVPIDGDVLDVDHGGAVDHDVVDDAWSTPTAPRRHAHEP